MLQQTHFHIHAFDFLKSQVLIVFISVAFCLLPHDNKLPNSTQTQLFNNCTFKNTNNIHINKLIYKELYLLN